MFFVILAVGIAAMGIATWFWIASQSPDKFARGYIAFKFRDRQLPENEALFADLAALAVSRAKLMAQVESKGVRALIHDEAESFVFLAENWYCGNDSMIGGDAFLPVVELLRRHGYPRTRPT